MAKLKRENLYVAFIDIMGFKDLLDDKDFEKHIQNVVDVLQKRSDLDSVNHPYLRYLAASDTIVITAKEEHAVHLLWKISQVQNELLLLGFATRGGVTYGEVFLLGDEKTLRNIFGSAYVDAYLIEREMAIYPRVVLDRSIEAKIKQEFEDFSGNTKATYEQFVVRDSDGVLYVNQFGRDVLSLTSIQPSATNKMRKRVARYAAQIEKRTAAKNSKIRMKWRWLSHHFVAVFKPFKEQLKLG